MNYMEKATALALKAYSKGEVPVGAVVVRNGKIISQAYNKREKSQIATHHAEILAIEKACKKLKSWRLDDCDLYVSLEPCPMCSGAILNARIKNVFYSAIDENSGGITRFNLMNNTLNHSVNCSQIKEYEQENTQLIKKFFKEKRKK